MFLRKIKGKMKETARITSKMLNLEADSGVVWEEKQLISDVDHLEKDMSHREEGVKTRFGQVVRGIHHERKKEERIKYTERFTQDQLGGEMRLSRWLIVFRWPRILNPSRALFRTLFFQ
jgi:hypothetical protein